MSDQERTTLEFRMALVETELQEIKKILGEVRDKVLSTQHCPAPGTCLILKTIIDTHEAKLERLQNWQYKVLGVGLVAMVIASAFGPRLAALLIR